MIFCLLCKHQPAIQSFFPCLLLLSSVFFLFSFFFLSLFFFLFSALSHNPPSIPIITSCNNRELIIVLIWYIYIFCVSHSYQTTQSFFFSFWNPTSLTLYNLSYLFIQFSKSTIFSNLTMLITHVEIKSSIA